VAVRKQSLRKKEKKETREKGEENCVLVKASSQKRVSWGAVYGQLGGKSQGKGDKGEEKKRGLGKKEKRTNLSPDLYKAYLSMSIGLRPVWWD